MIDAGSSIPVLRLVAPSSFPNPSEVAVQQFVPWAWTIDVCRGEQAEEENKRCGAVVFSGNSAAMDVEIEVRP